MIYSFLYILIASIGVVLIEFLDASVSPLFSLFLASLIAALFFNMINFRKWKSMYQNCWEQKWLYLAIMVSILVMWGCSIIAPGLIGASLFNFLYFTWLGALGFFWLCFSNWSQNYHKSYFGVGAVLLIIIAILYDMKLNFSIASVWGLTLSLIGGTSAFVYFKQSQLLMKRVQWTATQILAVRFYLTIIISFLLLPKASIHIYLTPLNLLGISGVAILSMIIPIYFQQKALEKITAEHNSIIMSLTPVATALFQELVFKNVTPIYFVIYLLYTILVFLSYVLNRKLAPEAVK